MPEVQIKVEVNEPEIERRLTRGVVDTFTEIQGDVKSNIIASADAPKGGRKGKRTRASEPGQSPARQTGALLRSIETPPLTASEGTLLRITAPHAALLQEGTANMAARPYVDVAVEGALQRQARGFLATPLSSAPGGAV